MIAAGDEIGRTQNGNNNAYCQDDEISWVNWRLDEEQQALVALFRRLTALFHLYPGRCHVAMRKARAVYALRIFKPPRRPRATWSSPRRVARGEIELT